MVGSPECGCNTSSWYDLAKPSEGCQANLTTCIHPIVVTSQSRDKNVNVAFCNDRLVHLMWHHTLEEFSRMPLIDVAADALRLWLDAPAMMSEREPHDTLVRAQLFNAVGLAKMHKKGFLSLNYFDMTLPFATNQDAAHDSMHYYSWLGRVMLHKFMNMLCSGWKRSYGGASAP